jgi:hypothetical protein
MVKHRLALFTTVSVWTLGTAFVGPVAHRTPRALSSSFQSAFGTPATICWSTLNSRNVQMPLVSPPSLHTWTIEAIAEALPRVMKAMINTPDDPYDVMNRIGSVAQRVVQRAALTDPEEAQVLGGRIVAILTRLELLEDQLQAHAEILSNNGYSDEDIEEYMGSPAVLLLDEPGNSRKVQQRAETILAWFLETIEGPGLRSNNVTVPCMEVDFLDRKRYQALITERRQQHGDMKLLQETLDEISGTDVLDEEPAARKSLHPMTIDIVAEVLRVRAKNDTEAPIRFINDSIEGWEILGQATKVAEMIVKPALRQGDLDMEEAALIGGRVVAIVTRLEDLEWELVHRCKQESWIEEQNHWDSFGVLPDESCIRTLDERILDDAEFAVKRAERLLALFLLNLEAPGARAAGDTLLDGSVVDFLEDDHYRLMRPRKNLK